MNNFKHLSVDELIQKAKDEPWTELDLSDRKLIDLPDGLWELRGLRSLDLWGNSIGDEGAKALAQAQHFTHLQSLDLWGNSIGDQGQQAFLDSPYFLPTDTEDVFQGQGKGFCVQCLSKEHVQHQANYYVCNQCAARWV